MSSESLNNFMTGQASSLAGTALSATIQSKSAKKAYEYSRKLMERQNELNIANWNMENEYNTPKAQRQRLKDAGINADLFYGGGSANVVSSDIGNPSAGAAPVGATVPSDLGSSAIQTMLVDKQAKLLESEANKNNAETGNIQAITPWISKQIQSELNLNAAQTKNLNEAVEKIRSEAELTRLQTDISKLDYDFQKEIYNSKVAAELSRLGFSKEESETLTKNFAKMYAAQINLAIAQAYASYVGSDAAALTANINKWQYELNKANSEFDNSLKSAETKEHDAKTYVYGLTNQWRTDLNRSGSFGRAVHNILSIPINALGGFFGR